MWYLCIHHLKLLCLFTFSTAFYFIFLRPLAASFGLENVQLYYRVTLSLILSLFQLSQHVIRCVTGILNDWNPNSGQCCAVARPRVTYTHFIERMLDCPPCWYRANIQQTRNYFYIRGCIYNRNHYTSIVKLLSCSWRPVGHVLSPMKHLKAKLEMVWSWHQCKRILQSRLWLGHISINWNPVTSSQLEVGVFIHQYGGCAFKEFF